MACTDIRGFPGESNSNTWGGRFYDNGVYIGHDEPDATFLSSQPGSGNDVTWNVTLGQDPAAAPTVSTPGSDVSHWFELSSAFWMSMALCDGNSYPQLPCAAQSDSNAPAGAYPGGGSAFLELQFYPPGFAPFSDAISCDNSHWCGALTIDSLECTAGFVDCNSACEEPVNFAFIQTNGVPTGPPSPQDSNLQSQLPNGQTLLMSPGDTISIHIADVPVPGSPGSDAVEAVVDDLTQGTSGFMQASAANGFMDTSMLSCGGIPFDFEPEYSTASEANIIPWAALQSNIGVSVETGHFEPCTALSDEFGTNPFDPSDTGGAYATCIGPYENETSSEGPETSDAVCYYSGDTHSNYDGAAGSTPPNEVTGCLDNYEQNGDLDFDGTPYWTEWPVASAPTARLPGSMVFAFPTTGDSSYPGLFLQTDIALSESGCNATSGAGCGVPPPTSPGGFYPYWSEVTSNGACTLEFGNVGTGPGVDNLGQDGGYGTNRGPSLGYPEFEGAPLSNPCAPPPPSYPVAFTEAGLPAGTAWSVTLNGHTVASSSSLVEFAEPGGTYSYAIAPVPGYATSLGGVLTVIGNGVTQSVVFSPVLYLVAFTESGLPSGTIWMVTLGTTTNASTSTSISFQVPNGSFAFVASSPGYGPSSGTGTVNISGADALVAESFTPVKYAITFTELGLPFGSSWSVNLGGTSQTSTGTTITFTDPNASYVFSVGAVSGFSASPPLGTVTVNGNAVPQAVLFSSSSASGGSSSGFLGLPGDSGYYLLGGLIAGLAVGAVTTILLRGHKPQQGEQP